MDRHLQYLFGGVLTSLVIASIIGSVLAWRVSNNDNRSTIQNLNARIRSWWIMVAVFSVALVVGQVATVILFGLISFLALREFITLTPTRPGDHRALFWAFFIFIPLHYYLVGIHWYGLFSVMIPVYAFLLLPIRSALSGDTEHFLERTAKIQWGLMICVYCVSHVPALLMLEIPKYAGQNAQLLLFFVIVVQLSDVLQYVCGKTFGKRKIAPHVSPNKTWEGFIGGVCSTSVVGAALWWATPFAPWQAFLLALLICFMGFCGGLCMSAIKRDRGVKDFGNVIEGHGGILDRIDSICFAAPIFFHIVRYWFTL